MWHLHPDKGHFCLLRASRSRSPRTVRTPPMQRVYETRASRALDPLRIRRLWRCLVPRRHRDSRYLRLPRYRRTDLQPSIPLWVPLRDLRRRQPAASKRHRLRSRDSHARQPGRLSSQLLLSWRVLQLLPAPNISRWPCRNLFPSCASDVPVLLRAERRCQHYDRHL